MGSLFSQFGSAQRVGFGLALFVLSTLLAWLSLRLAVSGPWYGSFLTMLAAAGTMTFGFNAWPDKLPPEVAVLKEKWDKAKSRSTKTPQGRFVWKLGRSAMASMLAYQMMPVDIDGGFMRVAFIIGLGFSAGFFGARAALWSGAVIFVAAHRSALSGLNVDFSDPNSREQLWLMWNQGGSMSWWWAVGLGLCPLLWIGSSGLMVKVGNQISEELAERRAAAIAKKKIDARRDRLRSQRDAYSSDALSSANEATERAKKRASAVANRDIGFDDLSKSKTGGDSKELTGVAKIEHDRNEILLRQYAAYAASIINSEKIGIDADTQNRRSFDRVIEALPDSTLTHLRSSTWAGAADLVGYYDRLCGTAQEVLTGGDGAVVTAAPSNAETALPLKEEASLQSDDDDAGSMFRNILERPLEAVPATFSSRAVVGEGALKMMLSESSTPSVASTSGSNAEDEELSDAASFPDTSAGEVVEVASPLTALAMSDHGIMEADGKEHQEVPVPFDDVANATAVEPVGETGEDPSGVDQSISDTADEGAEIEVVAASDPALEPDAAPAADVDVPTVDEEKLRLFAGSIISGKADRDVVLGSLGSFKDVTALAAAIGLPESMVADQFAKYDAMSVAARHELTLAAALGSENPDEQEIRMSVSALKDAAEFWQADADLMTRGGDWIAATDAAEVERLAAEARAEEEREQAARDQAEKEEKEQAEAARVALEAAEKAAEEQRAAVEREEAERAERAAQEAEDARLAALQEKKAHYVSRILVGSVDEDVLSAGMDLFPTVEAYAEAASLSVDMVSARYDDFMAKYNAKSKYDELRVAMSDECNLELVQALIANPESFEGYVDPSLSLADAIKWAEGVEVKQRVIGFADGGIKAPPPAGEDMRKLYMKKRLGTPDDLIEIIEKKLPEAIMLERQLGSVIALMPTADDVMISHRARASAQAATLAATIVASEKICKEYAMAFFPSEARSGDQLIWDMILDMAAAAVSAADASEAQISVVQPEKPKPARQGNALATPISFSSGVKSEEDVQKLDPLKEFEGMTFGEVKSRSAMERSFGLSYKAIFESDPVTESNETARTFSVKLGEAHGHGKIVFFTNLKKIPLWYHEATDRIHSRDVEEGKFVTQIGAQMIKSFDMMTTGHEHDEDRVRGIILISPYITEDGERSFAPLVRKLHSCPLIIQNNQRLNSSVFRAFVDKIKGG